MASFASTKSNVNDKTPTKINISINGKFGTCSLADLRSTDHSLGAIPIDQQTTDSSVGDVNVSKSSNSIPSRQSTGDAVGGGTTHSKRIIDRSHTLPPGALVRDVLSAGAGLMDAGVLSRGCVVTKFGASGSPRSRRVYFNFADGTVRLTHVVPLAQSFMSPSKGVFFLYSCYKPTCLSGSKVNERSERALRRREIYTSHYETNLLSVENAHNLASLGAVWPP